MKFFPLISITLLLAGCSKDDSIKCDEATPSLPSSHLEYFGFTLIDTYFDDPTDNEVKSNYIDEVHSFSNTADILVVSPTDNLIERMQNIADLEMKSMLHLNELFFEFVEAGGNLSGAQYDLRVDYQERWDNFVSVNNLTENESLVQAFYVGEEPTWNGIDFEELSAACDYIKTTIPSVPVMIIEAFPALDLLEVPTSADWIGFDHYFIKNPHTDPTFLAEYELLESKLSTTDQRTVLIMDTHYIPWAHGDFGGIELEEMKDVAINYHAMALANANVIGLFGYHWPSGFEFEESIGARAFDEATREVYSSLGKEITGKP